MTSIMESLRKWFYRPKKDDTSHLAQFFYADEALNLVAAELDSFDGRKDPERCTTLVNHLRQCQDKVLNICNKIMDELIPSDRADRDFRVKFPDDVMQDNLAGQLWFGAECLAAGSSIMNRETESRQMRPLATALTKSLETVRSLLREAALRSHNAFPNDLQTDRLIESLKLFDRLLADFELAYVSAMVPVKTVQEYELQQCVIVLFSETLHRALSTGLLTQEMVDQYDPALMFTIPRLAIVTGLLIYPHGPLSLSPNYPMSDMFRPFKTLLTKIRDLLWTLTQDELLMLERMLCSSEEPAQSDPPITQEPNEEKQWRRDVTKAREEGPAEIIELSNNSVAPQQTNRGSLHDSGIIQSNSDGSIGDNAATVQVERNHDLPNGNLEDFSCGGNCCTSERMDDSLEDENEEEDEGETDDTANYNNIFNKKTPGEKNIGESDSSSWGEASLRRNYDGNWESLAEMQSAPQDISCSNRIDTDATGSSYSSSGSSCQSPISNCPSSDTSSYNSDSHDDMEVALAVRAAELRTCQEARAKFRSSEDLVRRLFICIAGVADQLQTNFAGDLRNILKAVFLVNASDPGDYDTVEDENSAECCERGEDAVEWGERETEAAPSWVPDQAAPTCMSCTAPFTVVRRRHHCRNCGKVFCARCSSNSVPLPRYGHLKPVRVCNRCFIYQVTPFTLDSNIEPAN